MTTKDRLLLLLPEAEVESILLRVRPWEIPLWKNWNEFVDISLSFWKSEVTLKSVQSSMRFFLRHTDLISIESWHDTLWASKILAEEIKKRSWSPVTLNSHRKCINTYFIFLKRFNFIEKNPIMNLIKIPEKSKNMPTLTSSDIREILWHLMYRASASEFERLRNILFVMIAVLTGARPKELLSLTAWSISSDRKKIRINGAKQKGKERYYELNEHTQKVLSSYLKESVRLDRYRELESSIFLSSKQRWHRWTYTWVSKLFQRISKEIWKNVTVYMFRRHACTELFAKDVPIQNIQLFMWHNRLATTYRYNYNSTRNTKECTDILWTWG